MAKRKTSITNKPAAPDMNALVVRGADGVTTYHFKDERLNQAAERIASFTTSINANTFAIASILGKVLDEKAYTRDGFKSVGDFADKTFGMGRTSAYNAAKVGSKFLNPDNNVARAIGAANIGMTALVRMLNVADSDIVDAINNGTITADTTVKDVETWAQLHDNRATDTDSDKPTIMYSVYYHLSIVHTSLSIGTTTYTGILQLEDLKPSKSGIWFNGDTPLTTALADMGIDSFYNVTAVPAFDSAEYGKRKHTNRRYLIDIDNSGSDYAIITLDLASEAEISAYNRRDTRIRVTREEYFNLVDRAMRGEIDKSELDRYFYNTTE